MLILSICSVPEVLELMSVVNTAILIIKIVVPILLIITGMITLMNTIKTGNDDLLAKAKKSLINKCIAAILVFMIPTLVNVVVLVSDPENDYKACLDVTEESIAEAYQNKADELVKKAESSKKLEDYANAVSAVSKVKDESKRKSYQSRLKSLYECINK